jgi:hypothetical protein
MAQAPSEKKSGVQGAKKAALETQKKAGTRPAFETAR